MAVDFDATLTIIRSMIEELNTLYGIIGVTKAGKVTVRIIGDIPFSVAQKDELVAEYTARKAALVALFNQLP